jgi:hypothetical protein
MFKDTFLGLFFLSSYTVLKLLVVTTFLSLSRPQVTPRPLSPGDGSSSSKFNMAPQSIVAAPLVPSASLGKLRKPVLFSDHVRTTETPPPPAGLAGLLSAVPAPLLGLAAGAAVTAVTAGAAVAAGASLSSGGLGPLGPPLSALQLNGTRGGNVLQLPSLLPTR